MVKLDELARQCGEWLRGSGPESDIVISSRIRLARNLAEFPFIRKCTEQDRTEVERTLRDLIMSVGDWSNSSYVDVSQLDEVDRQFLVERQLISREHAEGQGARAVAIDPQEKFSLMVNEEDHLRIQVMKSGLDLTSAWDQINSIDDVIESRFTYAFHERWGYLTACPDECRHGNASQCDAAPARVGNHPSDRKGVP